MTSIRRLFETDDEAADRQTASLAGLAAALFLLVISLYLVRELHNKTAIEDCLLSGRRNCDVLVSLQR
jgi:hypothetical protein